MGLYIKGSGAGGAAIDSVVTGLTAGSVLFGGTSGVLSQDNTNLFYDDTNNTFRIGPVTPSTLFAGAAGLNALWTENGSGSLVGMHSSGGNGAGFFVLSTEGTLATPLVSLTGDSLFFLSIYGENSTPADQQAAQLLVAVDGAPGASSVPARWSLSTSASNGTLYERVRITSVGTTALAALDASTSLGIAGPVEIQGSNPLAFKGSTSGLVKVQPAAVAGTWTLTLPTGAGATGQVLRTDGSGVTSWTPTMTISDVTSARALDTTYANAYSNKAVLVFATVRCATTGLGGSATVTPKAGTSAQPAIPVGGNIGLPSGLLNEVNSFQVCFPVSAGSTMNYRLDSTSATGTVSMTSWIEVAL